ncbi:hypothetical protein ACHAP7_011710 [Fusarium lateritium]
MVDIGGTTSDFVALAPSGFPRQSPATIKVRGVRTAIRLPELMSIGLRGGSHVVPHEDGCVTVASALGGDVLTATDIVVAAGVPNDLVTTVNVEVSNDVLPKTQQEIRWKLERTTDNTQVSREVDQIDIADSHSQEEIIEEMKTRAIETACLNGATRDTVKVAG